MAEEIKTAVGGQPMKSIKGVHDRPARKVQEIPVQKPGLGVKTASDNKPNNPPKP